jgi:hypothetical protein
MDNDNEEINVAMAIERGLAMVTALGNNRIIGSWRPPAQKTAEGKIP